MNERDEVERKVAEYLGADEDGADSRARSERLMRWVNREIASRDVLTFVFVRLWLTLLEVGAALHARSSAPRVS